MHAYADYGYSVPVVAGGVPGIAVGVGIFHAVVGSLLPYFVNAGKSSACFGSRLTRNYVARSYLLAFFVVPELLISKVYLEVSLAYIVILASCGSKTRKFVVALRIVDRLYLFLGLALFDESDELIAGLLLVEPPAVLSVRAYRHGDLALYSSLKLSLGIVSIVLSGELFDVLHAGVLVHRIAAVALDMNHLGELLARERFLSVIEIVLYLYVPKLIERFKLSLKVARNGIGSGVSARIYALYRIASLIQALYNVLFQLGHIKNVALHLGNYVVAVVISAQLGVFVDVAAPVRAFHLLHQLVLIVRSNVGECVIGLAEQRGEPTLAVYIVVDLFQLFFIAVRIIYRAELYIHRFARRTYHL